MPFGGALTIAAIGAGTSLFGGAMNSRAQGQLNDFIRQNFSDLWERANRGEQNAQDMLSQLTPLIAQSMYNPNALLWGHGETQGAFPGLLDRANSSIPGSPDQMFGNGDYSQFMPGFNERLGEMLGLLGIGDQQLQNTSDIIGNRGRSPQTDAIYDRNMQIGEGRTGPLGSMSDIAQQLLGQRGQTNMTMSAQDRAMDALNRGGFTAGLTGLQNYASESMPSNMGVTGLTPTGANAMQVALQQLQEGGRTPATDYLVNRGAELSGGDALLPMGTVASMARNQVGTQGIKAYGNLMRAAMQRAGGPGVVAGSQGDVMSQFGDQILQAESDALSKAVLGQQGLQLQQQGQGLGAVGQGQGLATTNLGTAGGLTTALENSATGRLGTSGNLFIGTEQQAGQNQSILGSLGLNAGNLEMSRMGLGGQLGNDYTGRTLQGLSGAMDPERLSASNLFAALSQQGLTQGQQLGVFNQYLNSLLGGNSAAVQRGTGFNSAQNQGIGNLQGLINSLSGYQQGNQNQFGGIARDWLNFASNAMPRYGGQMGGTSPFGTQLQGIGQGIGQGDWNIPGGGSRNPTGNTSAPNAWPTIPVYGPPTTPGSPSYFPTP